VRLKKLSKCCAYWPFMVDRKKWHVFREQEQAIEAIARVLVSTRRNGK
jgi:hypothetical protein